MEEPVLLDVLCHLLELFWTHAHRQHLPILRPRILYQLIKARECPGYLCLAMCATSCRFSSHPVVRQNTLTVPLDECFASIARRALHRLDGQGLARIQALCVLIQYDAANCRGSQAWADSGTVLRVHRNDSLYWANLTLNSL